MKKRNNILTIFFSIICPGLGHLYNGKLLKGIIIYLTQLLIVIIFNNLLLGYYIGLIIFIIIAIIYYIYTIIDSLLLSIKNKNYFFQQYNKWYIYIIIIIIHFLLNYFPFNFYNHHLARFQNFQWYTRSMSPTINIYDKLFIDTWYYKFNKPKRDDILVYEIPKMAEYDIEEKKNGNYTNIVIKRCVALSGDKVEVKDYKLYLNDKLINERYLITNEQSRIINGDIFFNLEENNKKYGDYGPIIVPENFIFCLGDNRYNSYDSRGYGSININKIYGKVKYIYWSKENKFKFKIID